jgi:hypothetical protein
MSRIKLLVKDAIVAEVFYDMADKKEALDFLSSFSLTVK